MDAQDFIHAPQAQAALLIEKVGDVSLPEAGLLGQTKTCQDPFVEALPQSLPQIILQKLELHGGNIPCEL
ncbi:MAG: hypothetical protein WB729_07690 [Candidatus Sulfotelmatobacter sp.]